MRPQRLRDDELKELLGWMKAGFREYADLCGYWEGEIHRIIRTQIKKYGKEFGRVLRGDVTLSDNEDLLCLQNDLYGLRTSGCPSQAIVEMMLACTSDYGVTISDLLWRAQRLDECLRSHENLGFPRERCPTIQGLPGEKPCRGFPRLRRVKRGIPISIQFMLAVHIQEDPSSRTQYHLAYSYRLLKNFGYDHECLAHLLRVMQHIRRRVPAVADYLQTRNKDKFTYVNVQQRVFRFFRDNRSVQDHMRKEIREYLSGSRNEKCGTLLGVC
jgi:hypothetical protein